MANINFISITQNPTKTTYYVNEVFNSSGLQITAYYSDGTSNIVTGYSLSSPDMSNAGSKLILVMFEGKITGFNIQVNQPLLSSISITQNPTKITYFIDETFISSGLIITALYNNNSSKVVTNYTLSNPNMGATGTKIVTITYTENGITKTASFNITINPIILNSISVTKLPNKTEYFVGDTFNSTGLIITAYYNNGDEITIESGFNISNPDISTDGIKIITVTYIKDGITKTTTFNIEVKQIVLDRISITKYPNKTEYLLNETFDSIGLEITAFYNNSTSNIITDYILSNNPDMSTIGYKTITVTYEGKIVTFYIQVNVENNSDPVYNEYYQHIRFRMPVYNLTLDLKWIERLFKIEYDIQDRFRGQTSILDSNKSFQIDGINSDGKQEMVRITKFPHYTYPKIIENTTNTVTKKEDIKDNNIEIISSLIENSYVRKDISYYIINNNKKIKLNEQNEIRTEGGGTVDEKGKDIFTINWNMGKADYKFFLNVGYLKGAFILKELNYTYGSIYLDPGTYNIWIGGSEGGCGCSSTAFDNNYEHGGGRGSRGKCAYIDGITFNTGIDVKYFIGQGGYDAILGEMWANGGGAGGGGGGLTYVEFSLPIKYKRANNTEIETRIIYCTGGKGGVGGDYYWKDAYGNKVGFKGGGGGGDGGTYNQDRDEASSPYDGQGCKGNNGWANISSSGYGGAGYDLRSSDLSKVAGSHPYQIRNYDNITNLGKNGFIFIQTDS